MKKYEGNIELVERTSEEIYSFLTDFRKIEKLIPEQISNWEASEDNCKFTIDGVGNISLIYSLRQPYSKIVIQPDSSSPFRILVTIIISPQDDNPKHGTFQIVLEADISPILSIFADTYAEQFIGIISTEIKNHLNESIR